MHICVFQLTPLTPRKGVWGWHSVSPPAAEAGERQAQASWEVLHCVGLPQGPALESGGTHSHAAPWAVRYVAMRGTSLAAMGKGQPSPPLSTRYSSSSFSW